MHEGSARPSSDTGRLAPTTHHQRHQLHHAQSTHVPRAVVMYCPAVRVAPSASPSDGSPAAARAAARGTLMAWPPGSKRKMGGGGGQSPRAQLENARPAREETTRSEGTQSCAPIQQIRHNGQGTCRHRGQAATRRGSVAHSACATCWQPANTTRDSSAGIITRRALRGGGGGIRGTRRKGHAYRVRG
jgi:hypothetical protein